MTCERLARIVLPLLVALFALSGAATASAKSGANVQAGAATLDGTYHVGSSAGQYASTRDGGYGDVDPHLQQAKNQASYGVQSRENVRALVVRGTDGKLVALVSDDHYIPQDALWRRTAQILDQKTGGLINTKNLTMTVTHNHSSPSYSSLDWGVWTFQDAFDFRFFDYYANQNANAVLKALERLKPVRVSATVVHFDAFQKNPMGPGWADDGTPDGFPRPHTDHDLSVVHFQELSKNHRAVATLYNIGQHPEFLEGYDLISGEYPETADRFIDRTVGGVSILTQNATGTSEVEEDRWHPIHDRELFNHAQYNQMEWGARQLADAVIGAVRDIRAQRPNPDDHPTPYGGTSYHDRFVPWMSKFPVAMDDRWFPGPVSHPYPGVSSCRTDPALQGNPRLPVVGLPDCQDVPAGDSLAPVISQLGPAFPGLSTDTFEQLGLPVPENYSFPSQGALEDTMGVHMQAFRLGDILFTVCSCEQWVEQSYNIKTRTDSRPDNEYLGYDPTSPNADPTEKCTRKDSATWSCAVWDYPKVGQPQVKDVPDSLIQHMRAQITGDASGWDDPNCNELGCGYQAESEPTDLKKIRGNYTHDDTAANAKKGYKLTFTIAMANDYNGYIASYREYMDHDHYRKALTGWGPHSSDYYATRLAQMGRALKGDAPAQKSVDGQTDPSKADPAWAHMVVKEAADQQAEDAKVRAVGEASAQGVKAYALTLPDDGGADQALVQPKDIERFDAATFTWDGGNNYTDNPVVTVEREVAPGKWQTFADQSGEIPVTLQYPDSTPDGLITYRVEPKEWKWTATFEAFISRFPLVDPQGNSYTATPAGNYRFVVNGAWRKGNADVPYTRISRTFAVNPWSGITVANARTDSAGHVVFDAGPSHQIQETTARHTARPPLAPNNAPVTFTIGPVDFPDTAKDMKATGARFLSATRGYSGASLTDVEHYCLDCSFRPWLDATDALTATVKIGSRTETVKPDDNGRFKTDAVLAPGQSATVTIKDAWGDYSAPAGV
ncbi:MAG TPA: neutral/alkaline non-lysosomal ceramidase N-terminal domain-containing protein [Thermoleophilaceae bacterium]|nr:neutral/alkaline non-lysosomal ceramidase N-terminal domain-containing protein [Thermoleophilaceae bacterium]